MALPSFKVGSKELFLPNVNIALIRGRSPFEAKFHVPLWFSKLDLRDYLWHAYGVEISAVRSYVRLSRVQSGKNGQIRPAVRRWHRPRSHKYMTVDLVRPFVWPEEPEDYKEWNRDEVRDGERSTAKIQESMGSQADTVINEDRRERMKEQAKALLEGKAKWKVPEDRWRFNTSLSRGHSAFQARAFSTSAFHHKALATSDTVTIYDHDYEFRFQDELDARDDRLARTLQTMPPGETDDWEECYRKKRTWVLKIMNALVSTSFPPRPEQIEPAQWQASILSTRCRIDAVLHDPAQPHELERRAWLLMDEVIRLHRFGFRDLSLYNGRSRIPGAKHHEFRKLGKWLPVQKCSARLDELIETIQTFPGIALQALRGEGLLPVASSPRAQVKRICNNIRNRKRFVYMSIHDESRNNAETAISDKSC